MPGCCICNRIQFSVLNDFRFSQKINVRLPSNQYASDEDIPAPILTSTTNRESEKPLSYFPVLLFTSPMIYSWLRLGKDATRNTSHRRRTSFIVILNKKFKKKLCNQHFINYKFVSLLSIIKIPIIKFCIERFTSKKCIDYILIL